MQGMTDMSTTERRPAEPAAGAPAIIFEAIATLLIALGLKVIRPDLSSDITNLTNTAPQNFTDVIFLLLVLSVVAPKNSESQKRRRDVDAPSCRTPYASIVSAGRKPASSASGRTAKANPGAT